MASQKNAASEKRVKNVSLRKAQAVARMLLTQLEKVTSLLGSDSEKVTVTIEPKERKRAVRLVEDLSEACAELTAALAKSAPVQPKP